MASRGTGLLILTLLTGLVLTACGGTPAKAPAPATTAPAATTPAAAASTFDKLVVVADTVRSNENVKPEEASLKVCVPVSKWLHNERVVWRIKVLDPKTGAYMDDKALGQVEVKLSDGGVLQAKYGGHPGKDPTDSFWSVGWTIPENYPSGTAKYAVTAVAKDGRTSQAVNFNVAASTMTILDGKVEVLPKK